jgi:hypothetical protein
MKTGDVAKKKGIQTYQNIVFFLNKTLKRVTSNGFQSLRLLAELSSGG